MNCLPNIFFNNQNEFRSVGTPTDRKTNFTINGNHPVYQQLLNDTNTEHRDEQVKQLADLALLSQGLLSGEALTAFVNRSVKLMQ